LATKRHEKAQKEKQKMSSSFCAFSCLFVANSLSRNPAGIPARGRQCTPAGRGRNAGLPDLHDPPRLPDL
jgi:hypothetical protein